MPTTTADQQLPLPVLGDAGNVPSDLALLTAAVESRLAKRYVDEADRTARNPAPAEGELSYLVAEGLMQLCTVGGVTPTWDTITILPAWQPFVPVLTDISVGAGDVEVSSLKLGQLVVVRWFLGFGSGFSFGGSPQMTLPYELDFTYETLHSLGTASYRDDSGSVAYAGSVLALPPQSALFTWMNPASNNRQFALTAALPFAWADGDSAGGLFVYKSSA